LAARFLRRASAFAAAISPARDWRSRLGLGAPLLAFFVVGAAPSAATAVSSPTTSRRRVCVPTRSLRKNSLRGGARGAFTPRTDVRRVEREVALDAFVVHDPRTVNIERRRRRAWR